MPELPGPELPLLPEPLVDVFEDPDLPGLLLPDVEPAPDRPMLDPADEPREPEAVVSSVSVLDGPPLP